VYSLSNSTFDIYVTVLFGFLGYVFAKLECEPAPLILGFVLGPLMEENLRRAMLLSRGDATVFVTRPLSLVMLVIAVGLLLLIIIPNVRKGRQEVFVEET
jgi:TctA family transporter